MMKKTTIALAIAVASFASVSHAAPNDDTWYTGAKVGWSYYSDTGFKGNVPSSEHNKQNQIGAGGYLGYQANKFIGFELGYDWLGRMPYSGDGSTAAGNGAFKSHGLQLTAKIGYPITDDLDIYTRLGGMAWRADSKVMVNNAVYKNHDTGVSPLTAVGIEYALSKSVATRLDYQWVYNIGDDSSVGTRPDNGLLSVGIAYRFGQAEAAPIVVPNVAPEIQTKRFALRSDVLFAFGKATLKAEGTEALNQLFEEVKNIHPTDGSIIVLGYTDRIGSEKFNLALSEKRAQSVVDFLIAKGIPADKISARGMGKADPVTGNTCDAVTPRKALIECLGPDRRVEIQVNGTLDVVTQ